MAQQTINNGESGLSVRTKINANFTELYGFGLITGGQEVVSANTTADQFGRHYLVTASGVTLTIPALAQPSGKALAIKNASSGNITLNYLSDTDGPSTLAPGASLLLLSDGNSPSFWRQYFLQDGNGLTSVSSRTALAALPVSAGALVYLNEGLRSGFFKAVNAAIPVSDPLQGLYVASSTSGWYWARERDPDIARPEWWGAEQNNGLPGARPVTRAACQAAINVANRITFSATGYYLDGGLVARSGTIIEGQGPLQTGVFFSTPTEHLLQVRGVAGTSYAENPLFRGFSLIREVTPTTPASEAADITQGHGVHLFMVSNPIVDSVYTYNNIVDYYCSNILTLMLRYLRGLWNAGTSVRQYGLYIDGVTGGGTFGGPSPNPSAHAQNINIISPTSGRSYNYYIRGQNQDFWLDNFEAAGGHTQLFVDANNQNSGDTRFTNAVLDGYRTHGAHFKNVPPGSSIELTGWIAPAASATGDALRIEASHGITVNVKGDCGQNTARRFLHISDSSLLDITARANNAVTVGYTISLFSSYIRLVAQKNIGGGGASGTILECVGGADNTIVLAGTSTGQDWAFGFASDATIDGYTVDVSAVAPSAVTHRVVNAGTPVTTQGNVSWGGGRNNNIINPRAGAML